MIIAIALSVNNFVGYIFFPTININVNANVCKLFFANVCIYHALSIAILASYAIIPEPLKLKKVS
tara:strand:- start:9410 stop:9604 length:195 start_codon:yes stop_codon:yes gene_type:complete